MLIDRVYQLIQFIANKEQRGNLTPSQFNVAAEMAQREFVSRRLGNLKQIDRSGLPLYGYEQSWRVHEDLQQMIYGPVTIPVAPGGNFAYPYGYIHVDALHGADYTPIRRLTADQYPHIKRSRIVPPTNEYPVAVFRYPYGQIDPYQIGSIAMSYLKHPPVPLWAYVVINDSPVFDEGASTDFSVNAINGNELAMIILAHLGINLAAEQITQYALTKDAAGT
jgi:hypothetical protein